MRRCGNSPPPPWQVHKLRVAVEDEGTRGDGDNIPGAFKKVRARSDLHERLVRRDGQGVTRELRSLARV